MKRYRVHFRVVRRTDYTTPLMHLPMEATIVEAEDEVGAKDALYKRLDIDPDFLRDVSVEEVA